MLPRRKAGVAALGLLAANNLILPSAGHGQAGYPNHAVTMLVPFTAGGSPHFVARLLARQLSGALGQPFLVENRPGESGMTGTCIAGLAEADGYTLLLSTNDVYAISAHLQPCLFEFARAFAPIGLLGKSAQALCVSADAGFHSLADLVAAARAAPGRIRYSTPLTHHLPIMMIEDRFEISFTGIPAGGAVASVQALTRKQAHFAFLDLMTALPLIRSGTLRALAVTSAARAPQLPDIATVAEAGLPGFEMTTDYALFARNGTPEPVLQRLSQASMAAMRGEETRALLAGLGIVPVGGTREEFTPYFETENTKWLRILQQYNLR